MGLKILEIIIYKVIDVIIEGVSDYLALKKKKQEDRDAVNEAIKEKDPRTRASRVRDLLS